MGLFEEETIFSSFFMVGFGLGGGASKVFKVSILLVAFVISGLALIYKGIT